MLAILAELGVVGFLLFSSIVVGSGLLALRQPRELALFWLAMLAAWLVNALAHNFEDKKMTWLLFGLIVVSDGLRSATRPAGVAEHPARAQPTLRRPAVAERGS